MTDIVYSHCEYDIALYDVNMISHYMMWIWYRIIWSIQLTEVEVYIVYYSIKWQSIWKQQKFSRDVAHYSFIQQWIERSNCKGYMEQYQDALLCVSDSECKKSNGASSPFMYPDISLGSMYALLIHKLSTREMY